jgi:N-glycosylase/DNA lyase
MVVKESCYGIVNPKLTFKSGQIFLWYNIKDIYYIIHGSNVLKVSIDDTEHLISYESRPYSVDAAKFFRLDDDLDAIRHSIDKDKIIREAMNEFNGLRLLRQEPFQCLVSFICATNTSIKHATTMLNNLCRRFGKSVELDGLVFHTFPEAKVLANASISELCSCSLGYRARYVKHASLEYPSIDIEYLKGASYNEAKDRLLEIHGVGNKVADCILLFALEHTEAFPIDVWISRAVASYYGRFANINGRKLSSRQYMQIADAMRAYFGRYAGYAQQYLYCYARRHLKYNNNNNKNKIIMTNKYKNDNINKNTHFI